MELEYINTTCSTSNMGNCWSGMIGLLERCTKPQYEPIEERRSKLNAELSANPVNVDINGRDVQQRNNRSSGAAGRRNHTYQASDRAISSGGFIGPSGSADSIGIFL